jgi:hypothetical protein
VKQGVGQADLVVIARYPYEGVLLGAVAVVGGR